MYNKVLREVMRQIQLWDKGKIAVMVASHNEDTVRYTVEKQVLASLILVFLKHE